MNDFLEKFKADLKEIGNTIKVQFAKLSGKPVPQGPNGSVVISKSDNSYEINLVPEVKMQMIKAQKVRNLVLFICILVSSIAAGAVVILFSVKSGQDIAMASQDRKILQLSDKLEEYTELDDLLTIQEQLEGISAIGQKKTVLSRVFGAMTVMLPAGGDSVKLSELRVNVETSSINIEGVADARNDPLIDYRVLESFKKGADLTKYDYGRYVDVDGQEIPTRCIKESDENGNSYRLGNSYYAWWDLTIPGCEAGSRSLSIDTADYNFHFGADAEVEKAVESKKCVNSTDSTCKEDLTPIFCQKNEETGAESCWIGIDKIEDATDENMVKPSDKVVVQRVRIWRTPQFDKWYEEGAMDMNGRIIGVQHFESECFKYRGVQDQAGIRWSSENNCLLVPNGLDIKESANGRDESDNLVLRFEASLVLAEEFFSFQNKHMIAIGPMGQNVTDSYVQIGNMFTQEARACEPDDTECLNNRANSGGV